MMMDFKKLTLKEYLDALSMKEPVPGGGSAAALTAALGVGLISMVANYSLGRKANTKIIDKKLTAILRSSETARKRLLELVTEDAKAYMLIVAARKLDPKAQRKASKAAAKVGLEICRLCYKALDLAPYLVSKGNPYLLSDIQVAVELLEAAFKSSLSLVRINQ